MEKPEYLVINEKIWEIIPKLVKKTREMKPDFIETIQRCYSEKWVTTVDLLGDLYEFYFIHEDFEGMLYYRLTNNLQITPIALVEFAEEKSLGPHEYYAKHYVYILRKPLKVKVTKKGVNMVPAEVGYKFIPYHKEEEIEVK